MQPLNVLSLDKYDPSDTNIALDFQIADFRNISERRGSKSKTVTVPGTKKNDSIFGFYFDPKNEGFFDANKRVPAVLDNGILRIFEGNMILRRSIERNGRFQRYEFNLISENTEWFDLIKDKTLQDLSLSKINLLQNVVEDSWNNTGLDEYVFPLINYGNFDSISTTTNNQITLLKPALFVRFLFHKIFNEIGFAVNFPLLNEPPLRDLILIHTNGDINPTEEFRDQQRAIIFKQSVQSFDGVQTNQIITFESEQQDQGNNWANNQYTCPGDGSYNINVTAVIFIDKNNLPFTEEIKIALFKNNTEVASAELDVPPFLANGTTLPVAFAHIEEDCVTGDKFTIKYVSPTVNTPANGVQIDILPFFGSTTTSVNIYPETLEYAEGQELDLSKTVEPIKQIDFIKSITQMFNLQFSTDSQNKVVTIDTADKFYKDIIDAEDWTDKEDISRQGEVAQITEGLNRRFVFKYKEDTKDKRQEQYEKNLDNPLGQKIVELENEALEGDLNIQPVFAATRMMYKIAPSFLFVPTMQEDLSVNNVESFDWEPRILIYGGLRPGSWKFINQTRTTYPFSYFRNIQSTINDINLHFDNVHETENIQNQIFQGLTDRYYTNTINRFNTGKVVKKWLKLTDLDISQLDYTTPKYINKTYYFINKIKNYLPGTHESTEAELITL